MISLAPFLALRQNVFFVWVSLSEQKWVILAERRGVMGYLPGWRKVYCDEMVVFVG